MADLFGVLGLEADVEVAPLPAGLDYHAQNGIDPAAIITGRDAILAAHGRGRGEHTAQVALAITDHAVDQPFGGRGREC